MKFLIDAQLPRRLAIYLASAGHDALHTLDLPQQNRTTDETINQISAESARIVITKDGDFVDTHLIARRPPKLLFVATGNIKNSDLLNLFASNLPVIVSALQHHGFVELKQNQLIIHA